MGLFDDMLRDNETLFKNEMALDFSFLPKLIPFRESEQRYVAMCIKPLLIGRNGRNVLVHGPPGVGKTAAVKHLLRELEESDEYSDEVSLIFINCWQKNTTYKILLEIADQLGYAFTQNKNTDQLWTVLKQMLNKKPAVIVFDEIDKVEEPDVLYTILEDVLKKTLVLITNYKAWLLELDERVKSRLLPEVLAFRAYSREEIGKILEQRCDYAFSKVPGFDVISAAADKAYALKDVRIGLFLIKESGLIAEEHASKTIKLEYMTAAVKKLDAFSAKNAAELDEDLRLVLDLVRRSTGSKIGDLYKLYGKAGGKGSYKTFQRMIAKLDEDKFISLERQTGAEGNTTIVNKKLSDF
jgi:archaeal cell division control protein 6